MSMAVQRSELGFSIGLLQDPVFDPLWYSLLQTYGDSLMSFINTLAPINSVHQELAESPVAGYAVVMQMVEFQLAEFE